jgi:hypothetical protein
MSEWITDRLPDPDDAFEDWVFVSEHGNIQMFLAVSVPLGMPWQPIVPPAPYVKPKRWAVKWDDEWAEWILLDGSEQFSYYLPMLCFEQADAALRIADAYNEVLP